MDDKDIVLIMDGNGFIAGIQSVVMKEFALDDAYYPFSSNPYYVLGDWAGEEAYFTTAYFVDPLIICQGGRTQEEFDAQGTGYLLAFQNMVSINGNHFWRAIISFIMSPIQFQ